MSRSKPTVVLAGWLGCQPRHLRRYEEMYEQHGYHVVSRIATPTMVVRAAMNTIPHARSAPTSTTRPVPALESSGLTVTATTRTQITDMDALVWDIVAQIHESRSILFHVFSNGGCFLWERFRYILCRHFTQNGQSANNAIGTAHHQLEQDKIHGVVFDSCPAAGLHRIKDALSFCTKEEQQTVFNDLGARDLSYFDDFKDQLTQRNNEYLDNLISDPWTIPQLYLYCQDDVLSRADVIDNLVKHREQLIGSGLIHSHRWEKSKHCAHLLEHPEEYMEAIASFLMVCAEQASTYSRL